MIIDILIVALSIKALVETYFLIQSKLLIHKMEKGLGEKLIKVEETTIGYVKEGDVE